MEQLFYFLDDKFYQMWIYLTLKRLLYSFSFFIHKENSFQNDNYNCIIIIVYIKYFIFNMNSFFKLYKFIISILMLYIHF